MSLMYEETLISENCIEYRPKSFTSSMSFISQGCSSCISYISGKCTKELFEEIGERISLN